MTTTQLLIAEHEKLMEANRIIAARLAKSYAWLLASQEQEKKVEEEKSWTKI